MPYRYNITAQQLSKSGNLMAKSLCNDDSNPAWSADNNQSGVASFISDAKRNLRLQGKLADDQFKEQLEKLETKLTNPDLKSEHNLATSQLIQMIKESLGIISPTLDEDKTLIESSALADKMVEALLLHYSQTPGYVVCAIPGSKFNDNQNNKFVLTAPEPPDIYINAFILENKIFLRIKAERFPIRSTEDHNQKIIYLKGPVEGLFELDPARGFVLKQLGTDSALLNDLFHGRSEYCIELISNLMACEKELNKIKDASNINPHNRKIISEVLVALNKYREDKLSAEDLMSCIYQQALRSTAFEGPVQRKLQEMGKILEMILPQRNTEFINTSETRISAKKSTPFNVEHARGLMILVSTSAQEITKSFIVKEGIFSWSFFNKESTPAKNIFNAAETFMQGLVKDDISPSELLDKYLNLVQVVYSAYRDLSKIIGSELLESIKSKLIGYIEESFTLLIGEDILSLKENKQININEYAERIKEVNSIYLQKYSQRR